MKYLRERARHHIPYDNLFEPEVQYDDEVQFRTMSLIHCKIKFQINSHALSGPIHYLPRCSFCGDCFTYEQFLSQENIIVSGKEKCLLDSFPITTAVIRITSDNKA